MRGVITVGYYGYVRLSQTRFIVIINYGWLNSTEQPTLCYNDIFTFEVYAPVLYMQRECA